MKNTTEGKLPPQALEFENAVLGAIMLESECFNEVSEMLVAESFYKEAHARIYQAIVRLSKKYHPIDIKTVVQELKASKELDIVGGAYYVAQLTNSVASSANAVFHARILQQQFIKREIIRISSKAVNESYEESADVFELVGNIEKGLTEINKAFQVGKVKTMANLWNEISERNLVLLQNKGISGVPCGYESIDRIIGGWQKSDLVILAARPAMGKTSLAINFARNASITFNKAGLLFSLEMSALQIGIRAFSLEANVATSNFSRKGVEIEQMILIEKDCTQLINSNLFIDDTAAISLQEVRSKARKYKREKNIEYIIVDYLQLMTGDKGSKGNREQEISSISRGLKGLAKELEIPIIALSQLSRATESRGGDKRPQLSDLRESGAIEQDADIVMFVHRPEYYGVTEYPEVIEETGDKSAVGIAEIIISKHRNGATGTEYLKWIGYLTKFESLGTGPTPSSVFTPNTVFIDPNKFTEPITEDHPF